jgi:hypothetical protein
MEALLVLLYGLVLVGGVIALPMLLARRPGRTRAAPDPAAIHGFVAREQLDIRLPGPDDELTAALADGSWQAAARLLSGTSSDPELRWQRVQTLAGAAAVQLAGEPGRGAAWLRAWRAEAPKDAGAAQVHAEFLVQRARRAGADSADYRMLLEEARTVAGDATLLAPGDPTPYLTELGVARGLGYSRADFDALWAKITARAPHHVGAHLAALPCLPSRDDAHQFAERAAGAAPKASPLPALPLFAVHAHLPEVITVRSFWHSASIARAIGGALYAVETAPDNHPVLPQIRHLLVWFLVRAERYSEALEQLRHIDGHVGAVPWSYENDPAAAYAACRAAAVTGFERNSDPGHVR